MYGLSARWKAYEGSLPYGREVGSKLWRFALPPFNLLLNYFVALTASLFEPFLVENLNLAPTTSDKTSLLKSAGGDGYAGAQGSQHLPEQILRQGQTMILQFDRRRSSQRASRSSTSCSRLQAAICEICIAMICVNWCRRSVNVGQRSTASDDAFAPMRNAEPSVCAFALREELRKPATSGSPGLLCFHHLYVYLCVQRIALGVSMSSCL